MTVINRKKELFKHMFETTLIPMASSFIAEALGATKAGSDAAFRLTRTMFSDDVIWTLTKGVFEIQDSYRDGASLEYIVIIDGNARNLQGDNKIICEFCDSYIRVESIAINKKDFCKEVREFLGVVI